MIEEYEEDGRHSTRPRCYFLHKEKPELIELFLFRDIDGSD